MSPWSPLMCTTPFAPRAAPGSWIKRFGKLTPAGDRVSASELRLRSVPEPRTEGRAVTDVRPISLIFETEMVTFAPALTRSTRSDAEPSGAVTSTLYVPMGTEVNRKEPCASVFPRRMRLLPLTVTPAAVRGWPEDVTVPESVAVACANAADVPARTNAMARAAARSGTPRWRWLNMIPFAVLL